MHLSEADPRIPTLQSGHSSPHVCVGRGTHMCTGPPHRSLSASLLARLVHAQHKLICEEVASTEAGSGVEGG